MTRKKYTAETFQKAVEEINSGALSIYRASLVYNIPSQTLYDKFHKKYKKQNSAGAPTVLTTNEETIIVEWIMLMARMGFPVTKDLLVHSVHKLILKLNRQNNFKNGLPGRHWFEGFLKRHPDISKRVCQSLTTARVAATEEKIKAWFLRVRQYFEENNLLDVLKDPSRIFNCDESAFYLNPKGQAVLAKTGTKAVYYKAGNDEKECLTLLLGASAAGKLMPILALFPYKRIPATLIAKYPKTWCIGKSESGWMTRENFYEYIANIFNPFLIKEKIQKPVALFLDGHISHLSLHLCQFCKDNGIILIALLPNATHALQPMDVAVFHSLKKAWSKDVYSWRMENNGNRMKREEFGPILEKSIERTLKDEIIKNGFRKCGLYPFNENAIDYSRFISSSTNSNLKTSIPSNINSTPQGAINFLTEFEKYLEIEKLRAFEECPAEWEGDIEDQNLYYFWKKIKEIYGNQCSTIDVNSDSMQLGDSTIDANNCTLTDINLDWPNDDISVLEMVINEDNTLIPFSTSTTTNNMNKAIGNGSSEINPTGTSEFISHNEECFNTVQDPEYHERIQSEVNNNIIGIEYNTTIKNGVNIEENSVAPNSTGQCLSSSDSTGTKTPPLQIISEETPNKPQSEIVEVHDLNNGPPSHFPSPFKDVFFWPETLISSKSKKNIRKKITPTIASHDDYINYQRGVDQEKQDKITKAEQRKKEREEKKINQLVTQKTKKGEKGKKVKNSRKLKEETEIENLDEEETNQKEEENNNNLCKSSILSGDYVVVIYEEEKFPGQVLRIINEKTDQKYVIKTMTMSGFVNGQVTWRWPDKDDVLDYDVNDVLKKINPPVPVNKRGVFSVPDFN